MICRMLCNALKRPADAPKPVVISLELAKHDMFDDFHQDFYALLNAFADVVTVNTLSGAKDALQSTPNLRPS